MNNRLQSLLAMYEKDPKDSFLIYGIALEYIALEDYEKAEQYFISLLEQDPNYVPLYIQYAKLKENQSKIGEAKELYMKGIQVAKDTGDTHSAAEMEEFLDELE